MGSKAIFFSYKHGEINRFLSKFYNTNLDIEDSLSWQKTFSNPVEMSEIIAAFVDNNDFDITLWISLDEDVFIKISSSNADNVIKYLFERYPY